MSAALLSIRGLRKAFGRTEALRGVDLDIDAGEFVGLIGPNGAGKSTLIKILDGVHTADAGTITIEGRRLRPGDRAVAVVHQDLGLVDSLTVTENLRLGDDAVRRRRTRLLDHRAERVASRLTLTQVGLDPDLAGARLDQLSLGHKTMVAIARTLARGASIVVIDEATSALSPRESAWLIDRLRTRRGDGTAVVMVSHKMSEIVEATERCVAIVDGAVAADVATADTDPTSLARVMSPSAVEPATAPADRTTGDVALRLAAARSGTAGPFDLTVRHGEIVGVTGLVGSGLYDLALLAAGRTRAVAGTVSRAGRAVALLPPDRAAQANFGEFSVAWNIGIGATTGARRRPGLLRLHAEDGEVRALHDRLDVRPRDVTAKQATLSGGNQQKALLARIVLQDCDCVVLCEPTRGVDVANRRQIYRIVEGMRSGGTAVLVVSSDSEDLFELCDRVGVVVDGRLGALAPTADLSAEQRASLL